MAQLYDIIIDELPGTMDSAVEELPGLVIQGGYIFVVSEYNMHFPRHASIPDVIYRACHSLPHKNIDELRNCLPQTLRDYPSGTTTVINEILMVDGQTVKRMDGKVHFVPSNMQIIPQSEFDDIMDVLMHDNEIKKTIDDVKRDLMRRSNESYRNLQFRRMNDDIVDAWLSAHPIRKRLGMIPEEIRRRIYRGYPAI